MITINDRFMTGAMYAPFCRTKHAPMEEWDNDMKTMSELGYTCLHGFAEWHDIEYKKGSFDFSKIDHFVKCAVKNGLVPIINIATQNSVGFYSPRWLMEELRGKSEGFVDSLGQSLASGEYVVPCLDDTVYQSYAHRYLKEVARHFAGDERIGAYVLWGEPNLYSPRPGNGIICYCSHTKAKFRLWLKERYVTIDKLNESWGNEGPSDYNDFSEINPPTGYSRQLGGFNSWEDWREFMESNLAGHIKEADRIFKQNGALQPTITEMLPGINNGIDPWKLSECSDIIGISLFGKPTKMASLYMTVSDSVAKALGKSTFVVEAGGGSIKFDNPGDFAVSAFTPSAEELKTTLLMRAGYGVKGLMYWCWRPRLSDTEGNDFGMCKPNGKPLRRTREVGTLAKRMHELSPIYNSACRKADVAVYMSQQINHLMEGEKMTDNYLNSLIGANHMMTDLHINSDFICEKEILKGSLSKYKVLILPCTYIISGQCAEKIAQFVHGGGHVIADYILAEKRPGGLCYTELPGAGLDEVFGIEREDVLYMAHPTMVKENTFGITLDTFIEEINLIDAQSADVEYMSGYPLVTQNSYGKGTATYIATQYFASYASNPNAQMRNRIADYISKDGVCAYASFEREDKKDNSALITTAMYDAGGKIKIITVTNSDYYTIEDTMTVESGDYALVEASDKITISQSDGKSVIKFTLGALESFVVYENTNK